MVIAVAAFLGYRSINAPRIAPEAPRAQNEPNLPAAREISSIQSYTTPGGTDRLRFTLTVDASGVITDVKTTDMLDPNAANANLEKFSGGLTIVIKGKKLSELTSVDKIGTSSLTTAAFNKALPELQKQL